MIDDIVRELQEACDGIQNATAAQVAELMKSKQLLLRTAKLSNIAPVIAHKVFVEDTIRTRTSPDGHYTSVTVTAFPNTEDDQRTWHFEAKPGA